MVESKSMGSRLFDLCNALLMTLFALIFLYPLWHVVMGSLSDPVQLSVHRGAMFWSKGFSLEGYRVVLNNRNICSGYGNTLFYVIVGTILRMVMTVVGAYVLSRKKFMPRKLMTFLIVFTMYFGGGMIPTFIVVKNVGMYDTRWALIIPSLITSWYMLIMKTAVQAIPASLEESAFLDGANDLVILWRIILPVTKATLAVLILYYAVDEWNSWFPAMIYIRDNSKKPLQLFLREIVIAQSADSGNMNMDADVAKLFLEKLVRYCTIIVATLPILCVYPFVQRFFVTGVMMGSIKE
ncbi:MAG TPA: carbohydrate ABC transporter permease [Clostridia bacterium]|nr:carbohydrate ABC transporter permease [Clostridia bacterium]